MRPPLWIDPVLLSHLRLCCVERGLGARPIIPGRRYRRSSPTSSVQDIQRCQKSWIVSAVLSDLKHLWQDLPSCLHFVPVYQRSSSLLYSSGGFRASADNNRQILPTECQ